MAWKKSIFLLMSVVFLMTFSHASFACGEVLSTDDFSSNWMDVVVYYGQNPSATTSCQVSYEGKYCCDLKTIESVTWAPGKTIFAQLNDDDSGYVSEIVASQTTDEAYVVLPELSISEAITFVTPLESVLVEEKSHSFSLLLHDMYANLNISITNDNGTFLIPICNNCITPSFSLTFFPGENNVSFIAYEGNVSFVKNQTFYALDYLTVDRSFLCSRCQESRQRNFIPRNSVVNVTLSIASSHPFKADYLELVPFDFYLLNTSNYVSYSDTHYGLDFFVDSDGSFSHMYQVISPETALQKKYIFNGTIGSRSFADFVYLRVGFWFGIPLYFPQSYSTQTFYYESLHQFSSQTEPLILYANDSYVNIVSLYPKDSGIMQGSLTINELALYDGVFEYMMYTTISERDLDHAFVQYRVSRNESVSITQDGNYLSSELIDSDEFYDYYTSSLDSLRPFYIKRVLI